MFPLNDFNVVCCALATVSAAVGYRYSRHLERLPGLSRTFDFRRHSRKSRRDSSASESTSDVTTTDVVSDSDCSAVDYPTPPPDSIADITEHGSLKRKHRDEDAEAPNNSTEDTQGLHRPLKRRCSTPPLSVSEDAGEQVTAAQIEAEVVESGSGAASLTALSVIEAADPMAVTASPITTKPTYQSTPSYKPSTAFSAFAGSSSAFALASSSTAAPAWCSTPEIQNQKTASALTATPTVDDTQQDDPLAAHKYAKSSHISISGEEDEEVKAELKGAKLFVKRGNKEFSTGMLGHIKLLSDKKDKTERLVFRREPVWKVSMSVGLRPTVRCTFDEEQGILRLTLKEKTEDCTLAPGTTEQEVVVYALKRGKVSKSDFADFVDQIIRNSELLASTPQVSA